MLAPSKSWSANVAFQSQFAEPATRTLRFERFLFLILASMFKEQVSQRRLSSYLHFILLRQGPFTQRWKRMLP